MTALEYTKYPINPVIGHSVTGDHTVKRIKEIGRLLFSFRGRILRNKWLVAVGLLVFFNAWQANEISDLKKQVSSHANSSMASNPTVYVATGGFVQYHQRTTCTNFVAELESKEIASYYPMKLSVAKEKKYEPCTACFFSPGNPDAFMNEERRRIRREQYDFDEDVRRSLRRQDLIPPY